MVKIVCVSPHATCVGRDPSACAYPMLPSGIPGHGVCRGHIVPSYEVFMSRNRSTSAWVMLSSWSLQISSDGGDGKLGTLATPSSPHKDKAQHNVSIHMGPNSTSQHMRKRSAAMTSSTPGVATQASGEATQQTASGAGHGDPGGGAGGDGALTVGGVDCSGMSPPMPPPPASLTALAAASSLAALSGGR